MRATIRAVEYYLPGQTVANDQFVGLDAEERERIQEHTGIREKHIARENECASDLAISAANKLFASGVCEQAEIDFILLCTQSPDYFLPTTACLVQHRLGISTAAGALDINLGCSGFVYGLSLAKALIESGMSRNLLLLTAETYSKFLRPDDHSSRMVFGDGAAATLVVGHSDENGAGKGIGAFCFGTNGSGACSLIVEGGAARGPRLPAYLAMKGADVFHFSIQAVPRLVHKLLLDAKKEMEEIDLFVFHQANRYILEYLRRKLSIPEEKFCIYLDGTGNTVSSTIPIALKRAWEAGRLAVGMQVMLVRWGVGFSWAGGIVEWS
jgi:3-oxoacyl-[acyl-carrier-protein] synthase-3